jgi:hypothetical protein
MIPPLLHVLAHQPEALLDHIEGYGLLAKEEWEGQSAVWMTIARLYIATVCCLCTGAVLIGVACMLWISQQTLDLRALSAMGCVAIIPLVGAASCWRLLKKQPPRVFFKGVVEQVRADIGVLYERPAQ